MALSITRIFQPDYERYDGVRPIHVALMRLVYTLMVLFLGRISWTKILTHQGAWEPNEAVAWSLWAAFATMAVLGFLRPVKMLPLLLLEIFYKVVWLIIVAYPLWKAGTLAGSPAEAITSSFVWVVLPIAVVPWGYAFKSYVLNPQRAV